MQENDYIKTHTNSENWIGLREVPGNKMNWTDDSIEPIFVKWEAGEPVYNDSRDDCTYFSLSSGNWRTKSCDEVLKFVCEQGKASACCRCDRSTMLVEGVLAINRVYAGHLR